MPVPDLLPEGILPSGIHECTLEEGAAIFATNPRRLELWGKLGQFLDVVRPAGYFKKVFIDGSYVTNKQLPGDIDIVLQMPLLPPPDNLDTSAFDQDFLHLSYELHTYYWIENFPNPSDFRAFFQYLRPEEAIYRGLQAGDSKGILSVAL